MARPGPQRYSPAPAGPRWLRTGNDTRRSGTMGGAHLGKGKKGKGGGKGGGKKC